MEKYTKLLLFIAVFVTAIGISSCIGYYHGIYFPKHIFFYTISNFTALTISSVIVYEIFKDRFLLAILLSFATFVLVSLISSYLTSDYGMHSWDKDLPPNYSYTGSLQATSTLIGLLLSVMIVLTRFLFGLFIHLLKKK